MLIFIAHNGKTLELDVETATRIDDVQQALSALTSIPPKEQILLLQGNPLDPNKTLGAYKLPTDDAGSPKDVFLYTKAHLRQHVALPEPETVVLPRVNVVPPGSIQYEPHVLDNAPSPLLQTLPNYERQFRYHLQKAQAHLQVSQQREQICKQLLSEQEVQAMSIDAARMNVEHHFQYIARAYEDFMKTYQAEAAAQKQIVEGFQRDMEQLAAIELHPAARSERYSRLIHLIPEQKMWEWSARCKRDHEHFAKKVGELKGTFAGLQLDVEAMFMQMPSVDLDQLGSQLEAMQQHQQEQASIVDVLQSDLAKIESLVREAMKQLNSAATSSSVRPLDACEVMEAMNRHHLQELLPRLEQADASFEQLCTHCLDCKNRMTKDVVAQLQKISTQQSKIKALKGKLAVYQEVANKQAETFAELQLVKRVPVAYRHCLAECMRRQAFWEGYSRAANEAAHSLAGRRSKETAVRDVFKRAVSRLIPPQVLHSMGLQAEVPLCSIKLSTPDQPLLEVASDDLLQLPKTPQGPLHAALPFPGPSKPQQDMTASQALQPVPGMLAASLARTVSMPRQPLPAVVPEEPEGTDPDTPTSSDDEVLALREQNAKLRDQLASLVFKQCLAENPPRQTPPTPPSSTTSQMLRQESAPNPVPQSPVRATSTNLAQSVLFRAPSGASQLLMPSAPTTAPSTAAAEPSQGVAQQLSQQQVEERRRFDQAIGAKDERIKELAEQLSSLRRNQRAESSSYKERIQALEGLLTKASQSAMTQPQPSLQPTAVDFPPATASVTAPASGQSSHQGPTAVARGGSAFLLQPATAVHAAPTQAYLATAEQATSSANSQRQQQADLAAAAPGSPVSTTSDTTAVGEKGLTAPGSFSA